MFDSCDFTGTKFKRSIFYKCKFTNCNFKNSRFIEAILYLSEFTNSDIQKAINKNSEFNDCSFLKSRVYMYKKIPIVLIVEQSFPKNIPFNHLRYLFPDYLFEPNSSSSNTTSR
ncbi:MAG: pentapeptide repeat-containing protein [Leptospiraceae bacterium]|nr:pentapeptide repeat-containing protein [Leptospiraceae bacterium]